MEELSKTHQENTIEKPKIKARVDFVFAQHPELAEIGTKEHYSEYLDTLYPKSIIKDIVYHVSNTNIEKFRATMFGTYFSYSPINNGAYGSVVNSAIINVQNPLIRPKSNDSVELKEKYDKEYRAYNNPISYTPEGIPEYTYDASVEVSTVAKESDQIKVRNPEQIHVLGSKQDTEGFKRFTEHNRNSQSPSATS